MNIIFLDDSRLIMVETSSAKQTVMDHNKLREVSSSLVVDKGKSFENESDNETGFN